MNTTEKLMQRNRVTHTVDEVDFVCHRWCFALAVEAYGLNALGLVKDGESQAVATAEDRREMVRKALSVAMISPSLGDKDDAGRDIVTMRTLGDTAFKLFSALMGEDQEQAEGFPESSEGQKA
jgi:hypothetical protein